MPGQRLQHRNLSACEERWTRCNSTMLSQYYKWSLCYADVEQHQRRVRRMHYDWVLRTRTDISWEPFHDAKLQRLPAFLKSTRVPRHLRFVVAGRTSGASDCKWSLLRVGFVRGQHVSALLELPFSPCGWGRGTRSFGTFTEYLKRGGFLTLPLKEGKAGHFPWPATLIRSDFFRSSQTWCKSMGAATNFSCYDRTYDDVYVMMLKYNANGAPKPEKSVKLKMKRLAAHTVLQREAVGGTAPCTAECNGSTQIRQFAVSVAFEQRGAFEIR
eukprot:2056831-Prymnesium_polylepis.1